MRKSYVAKILCCILAGVLWISVGTTYFLSEIQAETELSQSISDGTYTIKGFLRSASSQQASMGNAAIVQPMQIIANGNVLTLRLECQALTASLGTTNFTGYLAKFSYFPDWEGGTSGVETPNNQTAKGVTIESYYEGVYDSYNHPKTGSDSTVKGKLYPHYMNLPITYGDDEIWAQVYVPVMESISTGSGLQYARLQLSWDTLTKVSDEIPDLGGEEQETYESSSTKTEDKTTTKSTAKTLDVNRLEDGIYSVSGNMRKTDKKAQSMANNAMNSNIKLTVKNGKYYLTLDFKGLKINSQFGYLSKMKYFVAEYSLDSYGAPKGKLKSVTIDSYQKDSNGIKIVDSYGSNYPNKVTFPLIKEALKSGYAPLQVFVPIMEAISAGSGTQSVFLKLDWSTLKAVKSASVFGDNKSSESESTENASKNVSIGNASLPSNPSETTGSVADIANTQTNQLELTGSREASSDEKESNPAAVPSIMSIFASIAGIFYKVKSRGL